MMSSYKDKYHKYKAKYIGLKRTKSEEPVPNAQRIKDTIRAVQSRTKATNKNIKPEYAILREYAEKTNVSGKDYVGLLSTDGTVTPKGELDPKQYTFPPGMTTAEDALMWRTHAQSSWYAWLPTLTDIGILYAGFEGRLAAGLTSNMTLAIVNTNGMVEMEISKTSPHASKTAQADTLYTEEIGQAITKLYGEFIDKINGGYMLYNIAAQSGGELKTALLHALGYPADTVLTPDDQTIACKFTFMVAGDKDLQKLASDLTAIVPHYKITIRKIIF
jgi:hypothetical protein